MGNMTLEQVNDMYLDVLREIGNIGAGNATSAIANMLGMKIDMNVPSIRLMEVSYSALAICKAILAASAMGRDVPSSEEIRSRAYCPTEYSCG